MAKGRKTGGRDFTKGDTRRKPNPRKGTGIPADVREALKLLDMEAVDALRRVLRGNASPAAIVAAAIHVLDRNHGRVPQKIEGEMGGVMRVQIVGVAPKMTANDETPGS